MSEEATPWALGSNAGLGVSRWIRKGPRKLVPAHHEWRRWSAGLWRCPWCDGFFASDEQPPRNATAMNNAEAAKHGIEYADALTKASDWVEHKMRTGQQT